MWKPVPEFPLYECSADGSIRNIKTGLVKLQSTDDKGYRVVDLAAPDGTHKVVKVHRLIAMAHLPDYDRAKTVDHINRCKDDNRADNLRIVDMSVQNFNRDMENFGKGKSMAIYQLDKVTGEIVDVHDSCHKAAADIGKPGGGGNINRVCNGQLKAAYGYRWSFVPTEKAEMEGEEWKAFEDVLVSTHGRIRSTAATVTVTNDVTDYGKDGRYRIKTIKGRKWGVHRLMAHLFLDMPDDGTHDVILKDGNPDNLHVSNLEVCVKDCAKKRAAQLAGERGRKRFKRAVEQWTRDGTHVDTYESAAAASQRLGIDSSTIGKSARGVLPHAGGFVWKYTGERGV